jgi:hypothetical protein
MASEGRNFQEEVKESEFAYKVLATIAREQPIYTSKLSEELDSSYHSLRKYTKAFEQLGITRVAKKEGKKKYLAVDMSGLTSLYQDFWSSLYDQIDLDNLPKNTASRQKLGKDKFYFQDEMGEELRCFLRDYFNNYLLNKNQSTLRIMLVEDLFYFFTYTTIKDVEPKAQLTDRLISYHIDIFTLAEKKESYLDLVDEIAD